MATGEEIAVLYLPYSHVVSDGVVFQTVQQRLPHVQYWNRRMRHVRRSDEGAEFSRL